jgi:hypothetical protein
LGGGIPERSEHNRIIAITIKEHNLQNRMLIKVIYFPTEFLKLFENTGFTTTHTDTVGAPVMCLRNLNILTLFNGKTLVVKRLITTP